MSGFRTYRCLWGWPRESGDVMTEKKPDEPEDSDEDWMKYANAGFGETDYSLWDDEEVTEVPIEADGDWDDADESPDQLSTHMEEIPRAPSPAGHKHLVRIGTCDHCLGRLGGKKRFEQSLEESGIEIRNLVTERDSHLSDARTEQPLCPFCENLYEESELLADIIFDSISPYELSRLQLGARIPKDQIEHEEEMRKRFGAGGSDALKSGLVRVIAQHLNKRLEGVTLVNDKPQVLALIDVLTLTVELDIRAHYLYGRYLKLERGIPHGMGREDIDVRCMGRGRPFVIEMKEPKIRSIDAAKAMELINKEADGSIKITGLRDSNRSEVVRVKDTPAEKSYTIRFRILPLSEEEMKVLTAPVDLTHVDVQERGGKGKKKSSKRKRRGDKKNDHKKPLPSVIDVPVGPDEATLKAMKKPELVAMAEEMKLKKSGTKPELIERILAAGPPAPTYLDLPENDEILETITKLSGVKLAQRTPERVAHRRADLIRRRTVYETSNPTIEMMEDGVREVEFTLRCESGTYVKETVHGDGGRTQPSLSSLIKAKCEVLWLDVGDIHAD